jgi:dihydrolipoamide dehydrogenase
MNYDVIVIGSGPGGYVAAIRAAQLGFSVAVVEKAELGGVCLNWGCIPTKSLLKSAQVLDYVKHANEYGILVSEAKPDFQAVIARSRSVASQMNKGVEYLFKKNKIDIIQGFGKLLKNNFVEVTSSDNTKSEFSAKHIILATGARSRELPNLKQDGKHIIGYREALTLPQLPESMLVVGSGAIGTELASFYNSMGTQVTLVEYLPNIVPLEDEEVSKQLGRSLKKAKINILTGTSVDSVSVTNGKCIVTVSDKKGSKQIETDIVLSAVGISTNIENIGLEDIGVKTDKVKIIVDAFYRTNIDGVYAIGDIVPGQALAHVASAEAICCVEAIAGLNPKPIDYQNIPSGIYTTPEVASIGMTEQEATEKTIAVKIGKFPYTASGKATAAGNRDGFVKLIFDAETDILLGAHFVGLNVTEMISEMVVGKSLSVTAKQLIHSIHPHPTMSEAIMEAAAAAHNEAIHV